MEFQQALQMKSYFSCTLTFVALCTSLSSFGSGGKVDIREGLGRDVSKQFVPANTPGALFENLLILGSRVK